METPEGKADSYGDVFVRTPKLDVLTGDDVTISYQI